MVADALLDALWADGSVIVSRDDVEQAVDWMDLTDTPWTGPYEANWADSLLSRDNLRAALDGADR
jgi:hypothetical protein